MIDEKLEDLLNQSIDREMSDLEQAELNQYLGSNPEARSYASDLRSLSKIFETVGSVAPPVGFKQSILDKITEAPEITPIPSSVPRNATPVDSRRTGNGFRDIWAALQPRFQLREALTFAVGATAGVALFVLLTHPTPSTFDESRVSGSMLPGRDAVKTRVLDTVTLEGVEARAVFSTWRLHDRIFLDVEVQSEERVELEIEMESAAFTLVGFRQFSPTGRPQLKFDGPRIEVLSQGNTAYRFELASNEAQPADLTVRLKTGGSTLEERIQVHQPGGSL